MGDGASNLPPGFRFFPTDEELVVHFLYPKAALSPSSQHPDNIIPALDLSRYDPWDLNGKALAGGSQWYYFSRRTQNRMTANGYWKPTGMEEPVVSANRCVGTKKHLVFYIGAAPAGAKTNWMMHEYHLFDCRPCSTTGGTHGGGGRRSSKKRGHPRKESDVWVLCRVYESSCGGTPAGFYDVDDDGAEPLLPG